MNWFGNMSILISGMRRLVRTIAFSARTDTVQTRSLEPKRLEVFREKNLLVLLNISNVL